MNDNIPTSQAPNEASASRTVPWWIIAVAAAAVLFAGVVVMRTGGDLQALLFLPEPPVPPGAQLIEQSGGGAYGTNDWVYQTPPRACFTVDWYAERGACEVQPGHCQDLESEVFLKQDARAATCSGEVPFGRYVMVWEADIYDYPSNTRIELSRQVPWNRTTDGN